MSEAGILARHASRELLGIAGRDTRHARVSAAGDQLIRPSAGSSVFAQIPDQPGDVQREVGHLVRAELLAKVHLELEPQLHRAGHRLRMRVRDGVDEGRMGVDDLLAGGYPGIEVRWGERGARVNAISPGIIITPLARDELDGPNGSGYRRMLELSPAGRAGTPDEVGTVGELLMTERAAFITGSDILIDGGGTASYFYGPLAGQAPAPSLGLSWLGCVGNGESAPGLGE